MLRTDAETFREMFLQISSFVTILSLVSKMLLLQLPSIHGENEYRGKFVMKMLQLIPISKGKTTQPCDDYEVKKCEVVLKVCGRVGQGQWFPKQLPTSTKGKRLYTTTEMEYYGKTIIFNDQAFRYEIKIPLHIKETGIEIKVKAKNVDKRTKNVKEKIMGKFRYRFDNLKSDNDWQYKNLKMDEEDQGKEYHLQIAYKLMCNQNQYLTSCDEKYFVSHTKEGEWKDFIYVQLKNMSSSATPTRVEMINTNKDNHLDVKFSDGAIVGNGPEKYVVVKKCDSCPVIVHPVDDGCFHMRFTKKTCFTSYEKSGLWLYEKSMKGDDWKDCYKFKYIKKNPLKEKKLALKGSRGDFCNEMGVANF